MDGNTRRNRVSLSDPGLRGRLRYTQRSSQYESNRALPKRQRIDDIAPVKKLTSSNNTDTARPVNAVKPASPPRSLDITRPIRTASPRVTANNQPSISVPSRPVNPIAANSTQSSYVPESSLAEPVAQKPAQPKSGKAWLSPKVFYALAVILVLAGGFVTYNGLKQGSQANTAVKKLQQSSSSSDNASVPSTKPVTKQVKADYTVAPDLPRYIDIPSFKVHARVLQVGLTADGAVGTPSNVFDTAWYTGSSQPGQPGAVLIDGHVSSWTSHGVFYNLKDLKPGDKIQVAIGNGTIYTYKVVKSQTFNHKEVDMKSALSPVVQGQKGLNLMTCTGDVISGTNEFNERIIVYTTQVGVTKPSTAKPAE